MWRFLLAGGLGMALGLAWQIPSQLEESVETVGSWTPVEILAWACFILMAAISGLCLVIRFLFRRNQNLVQTLLEDKELHSDSTLLMQEVVTKMLNGFEGLNRELTLKMRAMEKVVEACRGRSLGGPTSGS